MSRSVPIIEARLNSGEYRINPNQFTANRHVLQKAKHYLVNKKNVTIRRKEAHTRKIAKVNALLASFNSPTVMTYPPPSEVWINETLAQGDCFYSSLFRAVKERGFLHILKDTLKLNIRSEYDFIGSFRNRVAKEVRSGRLPSDVDQFGNPEDTYDILHGMGESLGAAIQYDEVFPDWFKTAFAKGTGTRKYFTRTFAKHAKIRQNYVSEIELQIVKKLLDLHCGILLETDGLTQSILPKYKAGKPLITLFNAYGGHYEYYSFLEKCPTGFERNRATRRCEKACRLNEERLPPKFKCTRKRRR